MMFQLCFSYGTISYFFSTVTRFYMKQYFRAMVGKLFLGFRLVFEECSVSRIFFLANLTANR